MRLHSEMDIPDNFSLILPGLQGGRRECKVVWRLGHEIGAEFVDNLSVGFARQIAHER